MSRPRGRRPRSDAAGIPTRRNWPLAIGLTLVSIFVLLAVFGPSLAPRDPREHNVIIQVDGEWKIPPYPAFTPGFPLGSDNLGRDLFSWLLWSVRPTMVLVLIVAAIRVVLGLLIGGIAGWSERWAGKVADALISGALAIPTLIGALLVITAIGFRFGVWAFVIGLSVTGWAETAQMVRERTRTVKGVDAVEAARALGASNTQVWMLHILPHIMPMVWMLLAYEISLTLVTTGGLGFLGYYLGGAVFTEVDDFVYQRISEMPELGQMLATAWMVLDEPWAMVAAGSIVFLIVLAFNLVGEGLQSRLNRKLGGARGFYLRVAGGIVPWLDDHVGAPISDFTARRSFRLALAGLCVVIAAGGMWVVRTKDAADPAGTDITETPTVVADVAATPAEGPQEPQTSVLRVPGGHIWANQGHDLWRARALDYAGPVTTTVRWTFEADGAFSGGPAIDAAGTLFIASRPKGEGAPPGRLLALDGDGNPLWETDLEDRSVGSPALAGDGTLYVADKSGLSAVSSAGDLLWRAPSPDGTPAVSGPIAAPDGMAIYRSRTGLVAVGGDGAQAWFAPLDDTSSTTVPHLSPDTETVYWEGWGFRRSDGGKLDADWPYISEGSASTQVVAGANGREYVRYDVRLTQDTEGDEPAEGAALAFPGYETLLDLRDLSWEGLDAGVTPDGRLWLSGRPAIGGMGFGFYWGTPLGELVSNVSIPSMRNIEVLGIDAAGLAYACMDSYQVAPTCVSLSEDLNRPLWSLPLRGVDSISGAALAPGRLYVATWEGELIAIGSADALTVQESTSAQAAEPAAPIVPAFGPEPAWDRPPNPGGHPWPMPGADAWGTLWTAATGPTQPDTRWVLEREGGFSGGPVVAADGTIYVSTPAGALLAFGPDREFLWSAGVPNGIVGTPAIGADGTVYVTDAGAYLNAVSPSGESLWRYHPTGVVTYTRLSSTGRVLREEQLRLDGLGPAGAGPTVAPDGTIYYSMAVETFGHEASLYFRSEMMVAVGPDGTGFPGAPPYIWSQRTPPRLGPRGDWVVYGDVFGQPTPANAARDIRPSLYNDYIGTRFEVEDNLTLRAVTGADGRAYFMEKRGLTPWYLTQGTVVLNPAFVWEPEESPGTALNGGALPDGTRWLLFQNGKFIWIASNAEGVGDDEVIGPVRYYLEMTWFGLDADATAYGCGSSLGRAVECSAFERRAYAEPANEAPALWRQSLADDDEFVGAALADGVLYVTTNAGRIGRLYAFGD